MANIALAHDYFVQMGGAERVAEELQSIFPAAPMFTTVDRRPKGDAGDVRTSPMQRLPISASNFRSYFMLYPLAVEMMDTSGFDVIISSSSGYAKGIRKAKGAIHVNYCHTPMRWVWRYDDYSARENFGRVKRKALPLMLSGLRRWDIRASAQPDLFIANSHLIAERINDCYGREATVIPPPIDVDRFANNEPDEDFYLVLSRLKAYKRLDLAIEACRRLDRRLIVVGDGEARGELEKLAGPRTEFLGRQSDAAVSRYAGRCRALIFPGEEDFGMTPLEINAAGRPVIAFRGGGAAETVIDGETGVFFEKQTVDSLVGGIEKFEAHSFDRAILTQHARKYDRNVFASRIRVFIGNTLGTAVQRPEILGKSLDSTFTQIKRVTS